MQRYNANIIKNAIALRPLVACDCYCSIVILNLMFLLLQLGVLIDRRVLIFVLPVFSFILLYSKLPHKVSHVKCEVQQLSSFKHYFWINHTFG